MAYCIVSPVVVVPGRLRRDVEHEQKTFITMTSTAASWLNALLYSCSTHYIPLQYAIGYASSLSLAFVGSLYVLVPQKIQQLDRDEDIHIQWRLATCAVVGFVSIITYPLVVCSSDDTNQSPSALELMGFSLKVQPILQVLFHTFILYLGANVATLLQIHEFVQRQRRQGAPTSHIEVFKTLCIDPLFFPFWPQVRNLWAAPALEELVFRACLVGPLTQSLSSPTQTSWIAPLFFGTAHVHHAYVNWKKSHSLRRVLLTTILQFSYTTLFGAYATHAFLRTNSLPAIIVSHQYCNYMGLPDLSFVKPQFGRLSLIYPYRWFLMCVYLIGVIGFVWGFSGILQ